MLVFGDMGENDSIENSMKFTSAGGGFRLVIGILAALTGVLKLLSPIMNKIPVLGDLIPSVAGIVAGFMLIFSFYREQSAKYDAQGRFEIIGETFLHYKKPAGIILIATAALHFLFPTALFL